MLDQFLDCVQCDIGNRGLARDPADNLLTRTRGDFAAACRSIADHPQPRVGIITGFMIPSVSPPTGETDGPPGTLFLAEALATLGIDVHLASDGAGMAALRLGAVHRSLPSNVTIHDLRDGDFGAQVKSLTHLIALERSGPSHDGPNRTMRGIDITPHTWPAHRYFEGSRNHVTIGIGDGGNEIGMGKIPREVIARNIPNGEAVACRTAVDHLIVCGISNWGGIGLAAGVLWLRGKNQPGLFDADLEQDLLARLVAEAPLVDGVRGQFTATVDGVNPEEYSGPMRRIRALLDS